ncbi:MAG: thiamine ABC transporter substrate-binding protein [Ornithinimicrobium sp.]
MTARRSTTASQSPPARRVRARTRLTRPLTLGVAVLALSGCSLLGSSDDEPADGANSSTGEGDAAASTADGAASSGGNGEEVVLLTHDSFSLPQEVLDQFTEETGYTLTVQPSGDAGSMTNQLALTKDSPLGDVVYGIDNTFASRAVQEGVLAAYTPTDPPPGLSTHELAGDPAAYLTPIDYGDVCVNVDDVWFDEQGIEPPRTLQDLADPEYAGLLVAPGASTSSPGLAFLLATIAEFGQGGEGDGGWQDYWKELTANDVKITAGWEDAYLVDFTAGGGGGDRPLVVSYASSPPFTIPEGGDEPTTSALMDTCFSQVEYAGVINGASNQPGAQALVDFMLSDPVQEALPESMYVFPVSEQVELPQDWAKWATVAQDPYTIPADEIEANRLEWVTQWADIATG